MEPGSPAPRGGASRLVPGGGGTVLLVSMRGLAGLVAFCLQYEFEDVVAGVTGADRIDAGDGEALELSRRVYKLTRLATGSRRLARACAPRASTVRLERDYELFFPIFNNAYELFALAIVPEWRRRCHQAVCFINELGEPPLPGYLLELLSEFDHVCLGVRHPLDEVARKVGRPCHYLPLAVDVLRFSPLPTPPRRSIDVCNVGRRSAATHDALVRLARDRRLFYYYDTIAASGPGRKQRTFGVENASEHRLLLANLLQRSRYYITNRGRVNEPEFADREEISSRFYEGAAAGTVMLGERPRAAEFDRQFGWPDSTIHLPFDTPDAARILVDLDDQPQRIARIRRDNLHYAALQHDWVYRLRDVFEMVGMRATAAMLAREEHLRALAARALQMGPGEDQRPAAP